MPRFHVDLPLAADRELDLPADVARHVQVLRLQPGDALTLFDGSGCDWDARVLQMGRGRATVRIGAPQAVDRELPLDVTLAIGMPANDRMDWLVEKATELGVGAIQPLICERSVLRLHGERAEKKLAHWRGIAAAAAEQSGRSVLPRLLPVRELADWVAELAAADAAGRDAPPLRVVLSLTSPATAFADALQQAFQTVPGGPTRPHVVALSGPEGGLGPAEDAAARAAGFRPLSLGPRVLRAETAPLALLAAIALLFA